MRLLICGLLLVRSVLFAATPEKEIVVIIPSYNNKQWCARNLSSVLNQNYQNFRVIYVNDCSTDKTAEEVEELARTYAQGSVRVYSFEGSAFDNIPDVVGKFKEKIRQEKAFFILVNNSSRCGALENLYRVIHSCEDHEIIVTVDGDDWLIHNEVLQQVNKAYSTGEIWMTHGKLQEYPNGSTSWCEPVPAELVASNTVRRCKCPSHLRTFYAWLFKKIKLQDLLFEGKFFPVTWDLAIMFPMLEMAAERHHFFASPNYMYNVANPINDNKVSMMHQRRLDQYIRKMKRYQRLEKAG